MNDLDRLVALLADFGITNVTTSEVHKRNLPGSASRELIDAVTVELKAGEHAKVDGYMGFVALFDFTPAGQFIELGIYE